MAISSSSKKTTPSPNFSSQTGKATYVPPPRTSPAPNISTPTGPAYSTPGGLIIQPRRPGGGGGGGGGGGSYTPPQGEPVGSGIGGGVLVTDSSVAGGAKEVPMSAEAIPSPQSRGLGIAPITTGSVGPSQSASISQQIKSIRYSDRPVDATLQTIKNYGMRAYSFFERVSDLPERIIREGYRSSGRVGTKTGKKEFFKGRKDLLPYEEKGTAVVTNVEYMTDEELERLPFQAGEEELIDRKSSEANFNIGVEQEKIQQEILPNYEREADKIITDLQDQVNAGTISVDQANEELQRYSLEAEQRYNKEINQNLQPFVEKQNQDVQRYINKVRSAAAPRESLALAPLRLAEGIGLGIISGGSSVAGRVIGTSIMGLTLGRAAPTVVTAVKERDIGTLGAFGIQTGTMLAGGLIGARIGRTLIKQPAIDSALSRAKVDSKIVAENYDVVIAKYGFDEAMKREFKSLVDQGYSVQAVESKLVPSKTNKGDSKLLPDVSSHVIEVVGRDGQVVQRLGVGKYIANSKGKIYSSDVLYRSIGKIESDSGKFYTQSFEGSLKGKTLKVLQEAETLDRVSIDSIDSIGPFGRIMKGSSTSDLITPRTKGIRLKDELKYGRRNIDDEFNKMFGSGKPKFSEGQLTSFLKFKERLPSKRLSKTDVIIGEKTSPRDLRIKEIPVEASIGDFIVSKGGLGVGVRRSVSVGRGSTSYIKDLFGKRLDYKNRRSLNLSRRADRTARASENTKRARLLQEQKTKLTSPSALLTGSGVTSTIKGFTGRVINRAGNIAAVKSAFGISSFGLRGSGKQTLPTTVTTSKESSRSLTSQRYRVIEKDNQKDKQEVNVYLGGRTKEKERSSGRNILTTTTITVPKLREETITKLSSVQLISQRQQLQQRQTQRLRFNNAFAFNNRFNFKPNINLRLGFPSIRKEETMASRGVRGYIAEAKVRGKYRQLTAKPVSKGRAIAIGAGFTSTTLSRTFRVVPTKTFISNNKRANVNLGAFRTFQQKSGKRIPLQDTFIQRSKFSLSSGGEKREIQRARVTRRSNSLGFF